MKCQDVQSLLSAYHDGELSPEMRPAVEEHVGTCERCGEELAEFEALSNMANGLADPEVPLGLWSDIEAGLNAGQAREPTVDSVARQAPTSKKRWVGLMATAALVLIATGVVWMNKMWHTSDHHRELAADFEHYLERFTSDPEMAQNVLLTKYSGRPVSMIEATRQLGYQPTVASSLPENYSLQSMYVLDMPCCRCVQTICRRDDGKVFAIFEHDEEQPVWFGDRPRIDTQCNGCPCSIIHVDQGLVASWKSNKRQLTVVGAHSLEEIADLVTHLHNGTPEA